MKQWYEIDPELLDMEKIAMAKAFPHFTLDKLDDGCLCWIGQIESLVNKRKYEVMCIYRKNFPLQIMGPSIQVCPILPDVDDIRNEAMFSPWISPYSNPFLFSAQILRDSSDYYFIGFMLDNKLPQTCYSSLKLFECWLAIIEAKTILGCNASWDTIKSEYPFINDFIRKNVLV